MLRRKKTFILAVGLAALLIAGGTGILALLVTHEPSFYHRAAVPAGQDRTEVSEVCFGKLVKLGSHFLDGLGEWDVTVSEAQINSFLEEGFVRLGDADLLKRQGISQVRIALESERIRVGFRYGTEPWSTLVSIDMRVWLVPKEVNVIALEILGRHAGALPISSQSLLEQISDVARQRNIDVTWYRHHNNPVALLRFQSDRRPTAQLLRLELRQGSLTVGGVSLDPVQTMAPSRKTAQLGMMGPLPGL